MLNINFIEIENLMTFVHVLSKHKKRNINQAQDSRLMHPTVFRERFPALVNAKTSGIQ